MPRFAVGRGSGDPVAAAERAVGTALDGLGEAPDLSLVTASGWPPDESEAALERASSALGVGLRLGAAVDGAGGEGRVDVLVGVHPGAGLRDFQLEVLPVEGSLAVVGLPTDDGASGVAVLLADPWSFPLEGFAAQAGGTAPGLRWVGGAVAPHGGPGQARLLIDDRVLRRGAVGVRLSGPVGARVVQVPLGRPLGNPMAVTGARGDLLLGLAGQPAGRALRAALVAADPPVQALATQGLLLGVAADEYADAHLAGGWVLQPVAHAGEAVRLADPVEVGSTVRLHVRDAERAAELSGREVAALRGSGLDHVEAVLLLGSGLGADCDVLARAVASAAAGAPVLALPLTSALLPGPHGAALQDWTVGLLAFGSGAAADRGTAAVSPA